jgi:hypothetical protein
VIRSTRKRVRHGRSPSVKGNGRTGSATGRGCNMYIGGGLLTLLIIILILIILL